MNRTIRLVDLIGAVIAIVVAVFGHYLYIRETVIRHEVQIENIQFRIAKMEAMEQVQFEKIEKALSNIQNDMTEVKLNMKDKADRESTQNK